MEGREFMTHDLQKASMWKRISAFLFDSILLVVIAVGVAFLLSAIFNFDGVVAERDELRQGYETSYGVDFDIEYEDYQKLTDEERKLYDDSYAKFATDPEANRLGALVVNLTLIIITFAVLIPSLLLEFMVPVLFGNGQTLGKKIFGIAVVRTDSVKISRFQLFIRAVLGKYTLETANLPLIKKFFSTLFGGDTPFPCDVFYINKVNVLDFVWGTDSPIDLADPKYSMLVGVRANGQTAFRIADSRRFIVKVAGMMNEYTADTLKKTIKGLIMAPIKECIAQTIIENRVSILEITPRLTEISEKIQEKLNARIGDLGIAIEHFNVNS
jgi:uncharacterized RDD family membrane protein YckC